MGADAVPDDVWLALADRLAVREGRATIVRPRQLEHPGCTADHLYAQPLAKSLSAIQVGDELLHRRPESLLLGIRQRREVAVEPPESL